MLRCKNARVNDEIDMDIHDSMREPTTRKMTAEDYILRARKMRSDYLADLLGRFLARSTSLFGNVTRPRSRRLAHG